LTTAGKHDSGPNEGEALNFFIPHPKPEKKKRPRIDWTGFLFPKKSVKLSNYEYHKLKKQILKDYDYICQKCKKRYHPGEFTLHHKTKRSILRLDTPENCEPWCIYCHIKEREPENES